MKRSILQIYMLMLTILVVISISNVYASVTPQTMVMSELPESLVIKKELCGNTQIKQFSLDSSVK